MPGVTKAPARLGLLFALTLALPAVFAGAWAWLLPGGVVERARAGERRAAEQALAAAATAFAAELQAAARSSPVLLQLDAGRRVCAPFAAPGTPPDAAEPPRVAIAEQAAGSRLLAGDVAGALPFFAHAAATGSLSPEGWLAYANAVATDDPAAARRLLDTAIARSADAVCGGLPFRLLALLAAARWSPATPAAQQQLAEALLADAPRVPAEAFAVVADDLVQALPVLRFDRRLAALRCAAVTALRHRELPAADTLAPGPAGSALVPVGSDRLAAVPAAERTAARERAFVAAEREQPAIALVADDGDGEGGAADDAPTRTLAGLGETWIARDAAMPASSLLRLLAHASLALAVVTLVVGNLALWRSTRRELALVRLRADFVDVVSHELRTPLTALSLKAEMLATGEVPADRAPHYLRALHGDVRRLTDQVERILDFGRLEQGAALRRERLPARAMLARGLRAGRQALRLVGQQLTVEAPRTLPAVVGDLDVLTRALRNLLENAAKYAPAGSTVAVRAFADHDELVIEVADRGPGVPAAERRGIFQPFVRGSAASPATPGSGLGLALVAAAAKVHAGRVDVRERVGGGAVFTLRLPGSREEAS